MVTEKRKKEQYRLRKAPFYVIGFFLCCVFIGIAADEPRRILEQAVRVCLSCIGIG